MKKILLTTLTIILTSFCTAYAGGPLVVKGGMVITYDGRSLTYRYDQGPLGMFSNSDGIQLFEDRFMDWQSLPTSNNKFQRDNPGSLSFDVNETNFDPILNSKDLLGYTPIIFDTNGKVLDAFLGGGAGNTVLGLSGPITINSGPLANQIAESQAIFNGRFIDGINTIGNPESTLDSFKGTIIHEFGHGQGLDHAQINVDAIKPGASQDLKDSVPLMFPVAVNDLFLIRRDDQSAISFLYPNNSGLTNFGKIEGKLLRQDGTTPVLGGNIILRNVDNPTLEAISCVSDYLANNTGTYTLFAIPPGNYKIEIEPIDLSFTGGSGVGPYTASKTDKSFQNPVPHGYYTGPNQPITLDQSQALVVNIVAGQSISNANIIASTTVASSTSSTSSSSSSSGSPTVINEQEPNNSPNTAQVITPPVTIQGHASTADDGDIELTSDTGSMIAISDLYKFTVSQTTSLNALLTIESTPNTDDLDLVLFDSSASEIIETSSQTGNVNELISRTIQPGTYLLGVGAFSGSTAYKLEVTFTSSPGGPATLTLKGKDTIVLQPTGMNVVNLMTTGTNFLTTSKCEVFISDNSIVTVKPKKFSLSGARNKKTVRVKVPLPIALDLIRSNTSVTVTVNVTCQNGANDEVDISITPNVTSTTALKANWRITKN